MNLVVKLKSFSFKPNKITFTDSGTYLITNEMKLIVIMCKILLI